MSDKLLEEGAMFTIGNSEEISVNEHSKSNPAPQVKRYWSIFTFYWNL